MNSIDSLLCRLLRLYPVRVVKAHFDTPPAIQADMITTIVNEYAVKSIKEFAHENIGLTKQHIYIYRLNKNFDLKQFDSEYFPMNVIKHYKDSNGGYVITCLETVTYDVIAIKPYVELEVKFYHPVTIRIKDRHVIVQATILEKNISSYLDGIQVVNSVKRDTEEEMLKSITEYFNDNYTISLCDINKGIKEMWKGDVIDSRHVKWKKSQSTATETMDEDYTLKQQYPEVYNDLINSPLNKTYFKYLRDDDDLCSHFTADPTKGELSVSLYPGNVNQIENVINEILENN